jgi:hypothetical protein
LSGWINICCLEEKYNTTCMFWNLQLPTEVVLFFFQRSLGGSWYFPQNNAPWTVKIGLPDLRILLYKKELLSPSIQFPHSLLWILYTSWLFRITVFKCNSSVGDMVLRLQLDSLGDKLCYILTALSLFSMKWPLTLIL